ncbi:MAG: type II secretion system minor pseudopilin GspJ [Marinobacter sp.]|nr:type II secretion system minor pseudopilin GspJ [Marinobacter sp.]
MASSVAHQQGFTLMEVLIAVTITSVIGMGVWQVINSVVNSRDRVNELANQFDGLQKAVLLLERDITQIVNRPARDVYGDFQWALTTREEGYDFMLTRQGWRNPLGLRRSSLQRVAWEYTGNELHRHYWPVVDQGREESPRAVLLLENVQAFDVWLLDKDGNREEQWPPEEILAELAAGERPTAALPRGIEVSLEHEQFGEIVRIFTLPDFDQAAAQELINRKQQSEAGTDAE